MDAERLAESQAAADAESEHDAALRHLAGLSPIEYDNVRQEKADELGCRVATLDDAVKNAQRHEDDSIMKGITDPEPWPEPVCGAELLDQLVSEIESYCKMVPGASSAIALWVLHTYCLAAATVSPILLINSPEKRCGKTTLLAVLNFLVLRPAPASNISPAVLFRAIEKYHVTLLIDEGETILVGRHANEELRGVINSGHTRFSAYVWRADGVNFEPKVFSTWGAKAIALIGNAPDTIMDRSIVIPMRRKMPGESIKKLRIDRPEVFSDLTRQCQRWSQDHRSALTMHCEPKLPGELHDRASDNWRPLVAIAELAGWRGPADDAINALCQVEDDESIRVTLLQDIRRLFKDRKADKLSSADIVTHLETLTDRPWPEWKNDKPMTQVQLARLLKPFKVKPKSIREGEITFKGYILEQFEDVFSRYAPSTDNRTVTPSQVNAGAGSSDFQSVTENGRVTDQNPLKPLQDNDCYGVTGGNPVYEPDDDATDAYVQAQREARGERAAILEYDALLTREEAERRAGLRE